MRIKAKKLRLNKNHTWKAKPGYKVCVLDRGAVRFDFPAHWIAEPKDGAMMLYDQKPCDESCDLGVSVFHYSSEQLKGLDTRAMLKQIAANDPDRTLDYQSDVREIDRGDTMILWLEQLYQSKEYNRQAKFRAALAQGPVMALITMNYWADRAESLEPVWDDVIGTLVLGIWVEDPLAGPRVH